MARKVTPEVARIPRIPHGIDLRSPSRHPDILGDDDLLIKVEEVREATGYRLPVSVKLGAGRVSDDVTITVKDGFDFIELDGMQGSTGAGSVKVIDYFEVPTLPAIIEAIGALEEIERRQDIEIVLMGRIRDGVDAVKALCLGADAVAIGTSAIIAGGCIARIQCHIGQCVTGIATQDPEHEKRYDPDAESHNIHRFLEGTRWQIAALAHGLGYSDFRALNRDDRVALTPEATEITGLPQQLPRNELRADPSAYRIPAREILLRQDFDPVQDPAGTYPAQITRGETLRTSGRHNPWPSARMTCCMPADSTNAENRQRRARLHSLTPQRRPEPGMIPD